MKIFHLFQLLFGMLVFCNCSFAQQESDTAGSNPPPPPQPPTESVFTIVEKMPVFGDCDSSLEHKEVLICSQKAIQQYMVDNVVYPKQALKDGLHGVVYCSFVINKKGEVTDVLVIKGVKNAEILDEEALRVIKSMPNWIPGTQRGKKVKVKYVLPVRFKLK